MSVFEYRNGALCVEQLKLADIAVEHGTPCYVYSREAITKAYKAYADALGEHEGMICYAVKANSNLGVLSLLAKLGAGFDIVSQGELERVLRAGGEPSRIVFSGVGKLQSEIERALDVGIACFNVESESELESLSRIAHARGQTARISLRVNPDVDAQTHPYISTGLKENKFGIDVKRAPEVYLRAAGLPGVEVVGVDCHIGSQLTELAPFLDALDRVLALIDSLSAKGITVRHLDLGGGLGVTYSDEQPPEITTYVEAIKQRLEGRESLALLFEPGRSIVANAGVLLTQVVYLKRSEDKNFAVVDAAMNDNIRPSLYQAWQDIVPLTQGVASSQEVWDIVGPICETGDFLGKDRALALAEGDFLALKSAGAYGFTMSSNYNSRTRAEEVLVDGSRKHCVRRRESLEDLVAHESVLPE